MYGARRKVILVDYDPSWPDLRMPSQDSPRSGMCTWAIWGSKTVRHSTIRRGYRPITFMFARKAARHWQTTWRFETFFAAIERRPRSTGG